jgi:hypothetical protein
MSRDPTLQTLIAIVAKLKADTSVAALVSDRVFDASPPQETAYPFISIGSWTMTDLGEKDVAGNDSTVVIHGWARTGTKGAAQIADAIYASLHENDLFIQGFQAVLVRHVSTVHMPDPDGKTHHVAATYRIETTTTS